MNKRDQEVTDRLVHLVEGLADVLAKTAKVAERLAIQLRDAREKLDDMREDVREKE